MAFPNCESFFDCADPKKNGLSLEQVLRAMIVADTNGCPILKVKTDISLDVEELNVNMADVEALLTLTNIALNSGSNQGNAANQVKGTTATIVDTTTTDVLAAPGAGLYNYITDILITNSDASVGTWVKLVDETSGAILWRGYAAAGGGGFAQSLQTPIKQLVANKKVQVICETTSAEVCVNISGYKAA